MAWYTGKSFVCPYSLKQVVWDSARRQAWKFPKPLCAPRGEAFEVFGIAELPPLTAPTDVEALPCDEKSKLEGFAKELSTFIKAYAALAVASGEMMLKRLLSLVADDVLPAWSKATLEESWSSCSAATKKLDMPVSEVPMAYEVKLCAESGMLLVWTSGDHRRCTRSR